MSFVSQKSTHTLTTGQTYAYTHTPASSGHPTFLLLHGFPSTSLIWDKLTHHLASAGYGVLAIDLLGYGGTDKPTAVEAYALSKVSAHVAEILEHEELEQVTGVGHDWGAVLLARMWWYFPKYFSSLVFMTVPYQPPQIMDLDAMNTISKQIFGYEMGGYWYFLISPEAPALLQKNITSVISIFYQSDPELWKSNFCPSGQLANWICNNKVAPPPSWMSTGEFDSLAKAFLEDGFEGPLNWYKAALEHVDKDAEAVISASSLVVLRPVTFVVGENDAVGRLEIASHIAKQGQQQGLLSDVKVEVMKGTAHWMMLEAPEDTFQILDKVAKRVHSG